MMDFKLEPVQFTLLTYYCIINITAAVLTVTDKRRAQKKQWRVPERTLLFARCGRRRTRRIYRHAVYPPQNKAPEICDLHARFHRTAHRPFLSDFFCFEGDFNEHKI